MVELIESLIFLAMLALMVMFAVRFRENIGDFIEHLENPNREYKDDPKFIQLKENYESARSALRKYRRIMATKHEIKTLEESLEKDEKEV